MKLRHSYIPLVLAMAAGVPALPVILYEAGVRPGWLERFHDAWVISSDELASKGYERQLWGDTAGGLAVLRQALERDPASPYRWCDYAEALLAAGDDAGARRAMSTGVASGGHVGPILMRAVNFAYRTGDPRMALERGRELIAITPAYDGDVFTAWNRMAIATEEVLRDGIADRRPAESFLTYLMAQGAVTEAQRAWRWAVSKDYVDDALAGRYAAFLIRSREGAAAAEAWVEHAGPYEPGYPASNAIFNWSFEREPAGATFDWKIDLIAGAVAGIEAGDAVEGKRLLAIRFEGTGNLDYRHVSQIAPVSEGAWEFEARVRTEGVTTDEGVGFRLADAEPPGRLLAETERLTGTRGWTKVSVTLQVPAAARLVRIEIVRRPSLKFDNRIAGAVFVDAVSLKRK